MKLKANTEAYVSKEYTDIDRVFFLFEQEKTLKDYPIITAVAVSTLLSNRR